MATSSSRCADALSTAHRLLHGCTQCTVPVVADTDAVLHQLAPPNYPLPSSREQPWLHPVSACHTDRSPPCPFCAESASPWASCPWRSSTHTPTRRRWCRCVGMRLWRGCLTTTTRSSASTSTPARSTPRRRGWRWRRSSASAGCGSLRRRSSHASAPTAPRRRRLRSASPPQPKNCRCPPPSRPCSYVCMRQPPQRHVDQHRLCRGAWWWCMGNLPEQVQTYTALLPKCRLCPVLGRGAGRRPEAHAPPGPCGAFSG